jgi:hypothetical protein
MFDDVTDEALESELCTKAAQVSAGECQLVLLIGEIDRREIWSAAGARPCAHYLSWRVGTSLGVAREQLRVARALEHLSHTREAFLRGELSYFKVRAITRVATEEHDEDFVELARHSTAAQLELVVREYRRGDPNEQARANAAHSRRYLRHRSDAEGMVVISARLDPEEAAVVLAAIELARKALAEGHDNDGDVAAESSGAAAPAHDVSAESSGAASGDVAAETSGAASGDVAAESSGAGAPGQDVAAESSGAGAPGQDVAAESSGAASGDVAAESSTTDANSLDDLEHPDPWSTAALAAELELEAPLVKAEQSALMPSWPCAPRCLNTA